MLSALPFLFSKDNDHNKDSQKTRTKWWLKASKWWKSIPWTIVMTDMTIRLERYQYVHTKVDILTYQSFCVIEIAVLNPPFLVCWVILIYPALWSAPKKHWMVYKIVWINTISTINYIGSIVRVIWSMIEIGFINMIYRPYNILSCLIAICSKERKKNENIKWKKKSKQLVSALTISNKN